MLALVSESHIMKWPGIVVSLNQNYVSFRNLHIVSLFNLKRSCSHVMHLCIISQKDATENVSGLTFYCKLLIEIVEKSY